MGTFMVAQLRAGLRLTSGILCESPRSKPRGFRGIALQFYFASLSPDSSRGDSKEKANRGLTQPYAGLAGPFPPAASSGVP